jgi:hypothetical protein
MIGNVMDSNTRVLVWTIVGTGVTVIATTMATAIGLAVFITGQLNVRIDDLTADVATLERRMEDRFDAVDARFDAVDARFDRVDARFARFDRGDARMDGFDERLRAVEIGFGKIDQRLSTIERVLLPDAAPDAE